MTRTHEKVHGACPYDCPWTTPDTLADMAGQSTFHSNRVWLRK